MYTMGVDVGSASSKVVILKDGKDVVAAEVVQVGTGSSGPQRALEQAYKVSGLTREDISYLVVTGYGRFAFEGADKQISEISCHAKGIYHLIPTARTIIDIGGQDAKAIRLDSKGGIRQFFMNDKCAAGTGRFLEVMARVLETTLDQWQNLMRRQQILLLSAAPVPYLRSLKLFPSSLTAKAEITSSRAFICP